MAFHGGIPSPASQNLRPHERYGGSLAIRLGKRALNFAVERLGGERPFKPELESGALAVIASVNGFDTPNSLTQLTSGADSFGVRGQLPKSPEKPQFN